MTQLYDGQADNRLMSLEPRTEPSNTLPLLTPPLPENLEQSIDEMSLLQLYEASVSDRRATPRKEVVIEWEERTPDSRYFHLTSDLSTFGLATSQGVSHPRGTKLNVVLHLLDGQEPLELTGEVLGPYDAHGGMRMAFRGPPVEAVQRIHAFLSKARR